VDFADSPLERWIVLDLQDAVTPFHRHLRTAFAPLAAAMARSGRVSMG
jgi:hypothetical protein